MRKLVVALCCFITFINVFGQINPDAIQIKKRKIKTVIFYNDGVNKKPLNELNYNSRGELIYYGSLWSRGALYRFDSLGNYLSYKGYQIRKGDTLLNEQLNTIVENNIIVRQSLVSFEETIIWTENGRVEVVVPEDSSVYSRNEQKNKVTEFFTSTGSSYGNFKITEYPDSAIVIVHSGKFTLNEKKDTIWAGNTALFAYNNNKQLQSITMCELFSPTKPYAVHTNIREGCNFNCYIVSYESKKIENCLYKSFLTEVQKGNWAAINPAQNDYISHTLEKIKQHKKKFGKNSVQITYY